MDAKDKFDHFQQANDFSFVPVIPFTVMSFNVNDTVCRFFPPKISRSMTVIREHHLSSEKRWGYYLLDCQAKFAWHVCFANGIISTRMKQKVFLDSIYIAIIQNGKMSQISIFNSLETI